MKAVRLVEVSKPLEMQEIPIPEIGERDLLIKVKAAGICHSDVHYRAGAFPQLKKPVTLGHEVAGVVEKLGGRVNGFKLGDRVSLHYLVTCGACYYCSAGNEQFCSQAQMLGRHIDGGYAEYIAIPARNAIPMPEGISFEQGATLMCASATAFHALLKARLKPGDKAAVFGVGGLGQSAVQLAKAFGATQVFAVDINLEKLDTASQYGAIPINAGTQNPVEEIRKQSGGRGVEVVLEMIGLPSTQKQAVRVAGPMGRVVVVGLSDRELSLDTYREILRNEVELIGSNDHRLHELPRLMEFVKNKTLDLSGVVTQTLPLDAEAINGVLDDLRNYKSGVRAVIRL